MDGARLGGARRVGRVAQVEDEDPVARPVHPLNSPSTRGSVAQTVESPSPLARMPARRAVDGARAEPRQGLAQGARRRLRLAALPRFRFRLLARRRAAAGACCFNGGSGPCRNAILSTHRQPRWALTRSTMIAALCCASSANAPSTLRTSVAGAIGASGIPLCRARRPLQLQRPGVARDALADDRRPVGDQARFAEAPRGERRARSRRA